MRKVSAIVFVLLLAIAGWLAFNIYVPVTPRAQTFVLLRPGYSTRRIARELKNAGVIRSRDAFVLWHALHKKPSLKAGEYLFEHDANVMDVHARLAR
ncbi:MAG TPA: aminodeoxychorismate lyase, partial [Terriglobales bacterium]|nr:aminodeoxychorismate lyase [Terriglobales bacterium]